MFTLIKTLFVSYLLIFFVGATVVEGIALKYVFFGGEQGSGTFWIGTGLACLSFQIAVLGKILSNLKESA